MIVSWQLSGAAFLWIRLEAPKPRKPGRGRPADLTIREVALPLGFVDVKVCAVTEVWSGLKLVIRKELR